MCAMRAIVMAVVAALGLTAPAEAGPRVHVVSAPKSATGGSRGAVELRGPRTGKVRLYVLTRSAVRRADKPAARGRLKRGKVTLKVRVPPAARTYRLIACLEGRKLRCTRARTLAAVAVPKVLTPAPAPPAPPSPP